MKKKIVGFDIYTSISCSSSLRVGVAVGHLFPAVWVYALCDALQIGQVR
jgi:hypothetical protein